MAKAIGIIILLLASGLIACLLFIDMERHVTGAVGNNQASAQTADSRISALAAELKDKGWIVCCARGENGTWDLFASRPDGSNRRNLTNTPEYEEAAPLYTRDSGKLLYRRMAKGTEIHHDLWGFQGQLMMADADGSNAVPFWGR